MPILEVSNLTKRFGDFTAVENISFSLKEGEILGLLGPNGAGKTTIIQMLLGILTKTSGEIKYWGEDFEQNRETILEMVNFTSTYINFPWEMTVLDSLNYISFMYDIKDRKKRIKKIIEMLGIKHLANKRNMDLSEGQKTKVSLTKSLINFPKILMLDEPTASLDPDIAFEIRQLLLEQRKNFNVSMIFTSHNMAEIEQMCDRVVFLNDGAIIAEDTPINLAKGIKLSHIELYAKTVEPIELFCKKRKLKYSKINQNIIIEVEEVDIPKILKELAFEGLNYEEISIRKPTLEDYFIEVANLSTKDT